MSEITIEGIAKVIREELKPVNEKLAKQEEILNRHTDILNSHTASLEQLVTKKSTKADENIVETHRVDRLEKLGQRVGAHVGIKLEL